MALMLVDTCVFIDLMRGNELARSFLISSLSLHDVLFSVITTTEMLAGKENDSVERRRRTLDLLSEYNDVVVDSSISKLAGDLRRNHGLQMPDAIIAASALNIGASLFTNNFKHFISVPGLDVSIPY